MSKRNRIYISILSCILAFNIWWITGRPHTYQEVHLLNKDYIECINTYLYFCLNSICCNYYYTITFTQAPMSYYDPTDLKHHYYCWPAKITLLNVPQINRNQIIIPMSDPYVYFVYDPDYCFSERINDVSECGHDYSCFYLNNPIPVETEKLKTTSDLPDILKDGFVSITVVTNEYMQAELDIREVY